MENLEREREKETDLTKSQLVIEICSIAKHTVCCPHIHDSCNRKAPFIDWYHLLGVEENAGVDVIKKRYHKLALQLHPDKNNHPKAELAFKLVSEAYGCLSDTAKRKAFNSEKLRNFCLECDKVPYSTIPPAAKTPDSSDHSAGTPSRRTSSRVLRNIRDRFREEARVIENCLKANSVLRKELPPFIPNSTIDIPINSKPDSLIARKESPVFDPTNYMFHGYPHLRTRVSMVRDELWYFGGGIEKSGSPIFASETGRGIPRNRSSCVPS